MPDYERRKQEHITLALKEKNQAGDNGLSSIRLIHSALPEVNWDELDISTVILNHQRPTPFFVGAMTGGVDTARAINFKIAQACEKRGWIMGVGSQRKQLTDPLARKEWEDLRRAFPKLSLLGNLGLSQLIETPLEKVEEMVQVLGAEAMVIHANALQECIQPEGTPHFKGGKEALSQLAQHLSVPVCLKETGCGFSQSTLKSLCGLGLSAVDVSGYGGTHWGRIEADRILESDILKQTGKTFSYWGLSTLSSLLSAQQLSHRDYAVWASGGVRDGLSAGKCLALGAQAVGVAGVILKKALKDQKELDDQMFLLEQELKITLFCTGNRNIKDFQKKKLWEWNNDISHSR